MHEQPEFGVRVRIDAYSGNVKPWAARVYVEEKFVWQSGFCSTVEGAMRAAERWRVRKGLSRFSRVARSS